MILKKGEKINNTYEVKFFIGQGAFGEVYRVNHKYLGLQVLKVFKDEYVANSDLDTITKEAKILSKLTHENIVRVFETNSFEKDGKLHYFITMGFVSGESLSDLLKREISIPLDKAIKIQLGYLEGLKAAQQKKVIHRDINPDNILLSYESEEPLALLSDFGLAQTVDHISHIAGAAGRYMYFAPECFLGTYLPTSDVFSAGMVFYKMIAGVLPWECEIDQDDDPYNLSTKVMSSRKKAPVNPSFFDIEVSPALEKVILKSMSSDIEKRYKSAKEFIEAIKKAIEKEELEKE